MVNCLKNGTLGKFLNQRKWSNFTLRSGKHPKGHFLPQAIPCNGGEAYVSAIKKAFTTTISEHKRSCRYGNSKKSVLPEYSLKQVSQIVQLADTQILDRTVNYFPRLLREAIEIQKYPRSFIEKYMVLFKVNRGSRFCVKQKWYQ